MVTVAVISSPNDDTAPDTIARRLFQSVPDAELEVENFVPLGGRAIPYVWVIGDSLERFERALNGYLEVTNVSRLERLEERALYRIEWDIDSPLIGCIAANDGRLTGAHGTAQRWRLTVWFEADGSASAFQECCRRRSVPIAVERLYALEDVEDGESTPVTTAQREALTTAYDAGYFERPRRITQTELAERLGISVPATGDRLRRGTANIVEHLLIE